MRNFKHLPKYEEYIFEKVIIDLILESKLTYSKKFVGFLNKMKGNKIADILSKLYSKDLDIQHNFIDVGTEKDTVSFTPERKVKEIIEKSPEVYEVVDSERYLTNSSANDRIFNLLGYTKKDDVWSPQCGTIGVVIKEVISPRTGKIFVWFRGVDRWEGKETVLNKEAIELSNNDNLSSIWSTSRNNIKIGRLVRSILTTTGNSFVDKDIEDFVNQYKATFDIMSNALARFEIVDGDNIPHWYSHRRYTYPEDGVLGNSCMSNVPGRYFRIYKENPEVCRMIILYDENGTLTDGNYKSDKIVGRCILWKTEDGFNLMDRIYTYRDSDVELFKEFGKKNGFYWKKFQDSDNSFDMTNGEKSISEPVYGF